MTEEHTSDDSGESASGRADAAGDGFVDTRDSGPDDEFVTEPDFRPVSDPIATARRRHGAAGAVLAAGLFGIDLALGRKPKEEIPVVVDAPTEPTDIDADGIVVALDAQTAIVAPPQPRFEPHAPARRTRRSRRH
ncbi:MAG: hypothetical protein ABIQ39_09600 [Ilumatobacteraceae bacterium]